MGDPFRFTNKGDFSISNEKKWVLFWFYGIHEEMILNINERKGIEYTV